MGLEGENLVKTLEVYCLMKVIMGNEPYPVDEDEEKKSKLNHLSTSILPHLGQGVHMSKALLFQDLGSTNRRKMSPVKFSNTEAVSKVSFPQRQNSSHEELGWCLSSGDDELTPET